MAQAVYRHSGEALDYTPVADVAAGQVVNLDGTIGVATRPIPAGKLGAVVIRGEFDMAKDNSDVSAGDWLYWDADGNPVGGTAGSGALTKTATNNVLAGVAREDAGTTVGVVRVGLLGHPDLPHPEGA